MMLIISYHAPTSALPNSGLSFSVSVFTIMMSMISPGMAAESKTCVESGMAAISESSGFQVTAEVTSGVE
jgi:hypothetical protein